MQYGILFRLRSWWIGVHWSPKNKRVCINPVPMVTFWFTFEGGITPAREKQADSIAIRAANDIAYIYATSPAETPQDMMHRMKRVRDRVTQAMRYH